MLMTKLVAPQGTEQVEVLNADVLSATTINGEELRKLKGNVQFKQGDVLLFCDSAYFYTQQNKVNAYNNIHIQQGENVHVNGELLEYFGATKTAIITKNVRLNDGKINLTTDKLNYDTKNKLGSYTTGATIIDGENTLTSQRGYYNGFSQNLNFRKDVVLVNPRYVMKSDTLEYNTISNIAKFYGPTTITASRDVLYCENGYYNTQTDIARFGKNAYLRSDNQWLYGDSLYYDRNRGYGRANSNIKVLDTSQKMLIEGDFAEHYEKTRRTMITRNVLCSKGLETDSIYLSADTVRVYYDSTGKYRILKGCQRVKIYNLQFQGICDTIYFTFSDSVLDMRQKPILWFGTYQCTAERVKMKMKNGQMHLAELISDAFVVLPEDSSEYYSQIKGRDMYAYFLKNEIFHIDVNGNAESIYFPRDEKKLFIGMNHITSLDIKIKVQNKKIKKINFINEPVATMIPMQDVSSDNALLPGFSWQIDRRPNSIADLRLKPPAENPLAPKKVVPKNTIAKPKPKPKIKPKAKKALPNKGKPKIGPEPPKK